MRFDKWMTSASRMMIAKSDSHLEAQQRRRALSSFWRIRPRKSSLSVRFDKSYEAYTLEASLQRALDPA